MAITTSVRTSFSLRMLFIVAVCLGIGLWGVYDIAWGVPNQRVAFERRQAAAAILDAFDYQLEPREAYLENRIEAVAIVQDQLNAVTADARAAHGIERTFDLATQEGLTFAALVLATGSAEPDVAETWSEHEDWPDAERLAQAMADAPPVERLWFTHLLRYAVVLHEPLPAGRPMPPNVSEVYEIAKQDVERYAGATAPRAFDPWIDWMAALSLPFAPYFLAVWWRARRERYRLDDDGTLHTPAGAWPRDEIADIDMSRWMRKSIAEVVHRDGTRIKLDDYMHEDMHLIVGAIASERYPEQWTHEARVVQPEAAAGHEAAQEDAAAADRPQERTNPPHPPHPPDPRPVAAGESAEQAGPHDRSRAHPDRD